MIKNLVFKLVLSQTVWPALFTAAFAVFALSQPAFCQNTARVSGFVYDPSGAVIPGAAVTLRDESGATVLKSVTDGSGLYSFDPVPPKTYTLTVEARGFKVFTETGLVVEPSDRINPKVTLTVGQSTQAVQVQAQAQDEVLTDTGAKVDTLESQEIQNISTVGRDGLELLFLLPGVVNMGYNASGGSSFLANNLGNANINGLRNDQSDYRMDNSHLLCPGNNNAFDIEPNMDMIAEFSVKTSNFEADQGRSATIIDTVSKSGGKDFHGELYWYNRNAATNANDFSNNLAGIPKPNSLFNYPGFNIGGPILLPGTSFNRGRDKLFFFVGVEFQRQLPDPGTELAVVPTANERTGDFSDLMNPNFCTTSGGVVTGGTYLKQPCILTNPTTGAPFPNNQIPAAMMTPNDQKFLNLFPLPNYRDPNGVYNYAGHPLEPLNRNEEWFKVDYNITQNTRMFVRVNREREKTIYTYGLWNGANSGFGSNIPEPSPIDQPYEGDSAAINLVTVINPTLTNEIQFNRQDNLADNRYADPRKLSKSALGFQFSGIFANGSDTVPQINDNYSYGGGSPGAGRWGNGNVANDVFGHAYEGEILDNLTKVSGRHTLKFGVLIDRVPNDQDFGKQTEGMLITNESFQSTGSEFGDILTERYSAFTQASADLEGRYRYWTVEWYGTDSFKVNSRLTVNFGARWSWMQPWQVLDNRAVTFDPTVWNPNQPTNVLNGLLYASKGQVSNGVFPSPRPSTQPRVGFAYDPFGKGKSVLRGGFGTFVQRDQGNVIFNILASPPNEYISTPSPPNGQSKFNSFSQIEATDPFNGLGVISAQAWNHRDSNQPEAYEWSLTWSQNLGQKTVLETSYVGNVSRHLFAEHDLNAVVPGSMWLPGTTEVFNTNDEMFRHYQPWGSIYWSDHSQTSNYNSLQASARRTVSHGLDLLLSYTWSKTLGYAPYYNTVLDAFDTHRNYGLLPFDRAQLLNIAYIYQLPSLGARYMQNSRVTKGVLDGWQLSGVTKFASGDALSVRSPQINCVNAPGETNPISLALCNDGTQFTGDGRTWYGTQDEPVNPVVVSNMQQGRNFTGLNGNWLAPGVSVPAIGHYGTFEQPTVRGPGYNNFDMTLFKRFKLGEKRQLEFRVAAFDIFNRAQLQDPQTFADFNWTLPAGATSLTQGTPSLINGNTFGRIFDKTGHRQMEFAGKFYF